MSAVLAVLVTAVIFAVIGWALADMHRHAKPKPNGWKRPPVARTLASRQLREAQVRPLFIPPQTRRVAVTEPEDAA